MRSTPRAISLVPVPPAWSNTEHPGAGGLCQFYSDRGGEAERLFERLARIDEVVRGPWSRKRR